MAKPGVERWFGARWCLAMSASSLVLCLFLLTKQELFAKQAAHTKGRVVSCIAQGIGRSQSSMVIYRDTVDFTSKSGSIVSFTASSTRWTDPNTTISVIYDPSNPSIAALDLPFYNRSGSTCLLIVPALLFYLLSLKRPSPSDYRLLWNRGLHGRR